MKTRDELLAAREEIDRQIAALDAGPDLSEAVQAYRSTWYAEGTPDERVAKGLIAAYPALRKAMGDDPRATWPNDLELEGMARDIAMIAHEADSPDPVHHAAHLGISTGLHRAALPLAPLARAQMGEAEIEALARKWEDAPSAGGGRLSRRDIIIRAVREALSRVPVAAWPGEDELRELRQALVNHNDVLRSAHAVAARRGADTNWDTFSPRIGSVLAFHHETVSAARNALLEEASDRILGEQP